MYIRIAAVLALVVIVLVLANCAPKRDNYWGQVATGVGETLKR